LGGDSTFPALPADFFGPGSVPFSGDIPLKGSKIRENAISVERTSGFSFGTPLAPHDIFSKVTAFNLESIAPINVNFSDGSTQQWDVMVSGRRDENSSCWIRVAHNLPGESDGGTILTDGTFFDVVADVMFSHTPASGPRRFRGFAIIDRTQLATSDAKWAHSHSSIAGGAYREFIPGADPADPFAPLQVLFFDGGGLDLPLRVIDVVPEPSAMLVLLSAVTCLVAGFRRCC
jgi:hypothetical protein